MSAANCKICGKPAPAPRALVPGKFVWCSAECWRQEGVLVARHIKERTPFEWDPRRLAYRGSAGPRR